MRFIERYAVEITALVSLVTLTLVAEYNREYGTQPEYLEYVTKDVKTRCLSKANEGDANIGLLGGRAAAYFVAVEDCVREHEPAAFRKVRGQKDE